jgi:ribonuclease Z
VDHILVGAVGYRLEWNGLSMAFTGDSIPTRVEAVMSMDVDVFIHELTLDVKTYSEKNNVPLQIAQNIVDKHTSAEKLGEIFSIARPKLGVGTHFFTNDSTIDKAFAGIASNYSGPVVIAQDLMVINVTPEQIVTRMARTDWLSWVAPAPKPADGKKPQLDPAPTEGRTPNWVVDTRILDEK